MTNWKQTARFAVVNVLVLSQFGCGGGGSGSSSGSGSGTSYVPPADVGGNSISGAYRWHFGRSVNARIDNRSDHDFFRFDLSSPGTLTVYSRGDCDPIAMLVDANGRGLAYDDDSGSNFNFRLSEELSTGTYYLDVSRASGQEECNYSVDGSFERGATDVGGSSMSSAYLLRLDESVSARLDSSSDVDYFRVNVTHAGTLTASSTGNADPRAELLDANGNRLESDDDSGSDYNFSLPAHVTPGTYYVRVSPASSTRLGEYRVRVSLSEDTASNSGSEGTNPGAEGQFTFVLTWSWQGSSRPHGPDLDLYVTDPSGEEISATSGNFRSASGGVLDMDDRGDWNNSNGTYGDGGGPERIYWSSEAPTGDYRYGVVWYEGDGAATYRIRIYDVDGNLVREQRGQFSQAPSETHYYREVGRITAY